jgi:hypothetical protein
VSVEQGLNSNFGKSGFSRNIMYVSQRNTVFRYWATPSYNNAGSTWLIPQSVGEISSRNSAILSLSGSGSILGGITSPGSASFSIDCAPVTGALVAFGTGTATLSINTNSPLLTASANAIGTATLTINGQTSLLGAVTSGEGASTISFVASATILPTVDTSPLRTASATFSLSGALTPYAIGNMTGSTANTSVLTAESVAFEVWNALSADFNLTGTMGRKLNTASAGGVDNTDVLTAVAAVPAAVLSAAQATPIHADTQKINGADVIGDGSEADQWRGSGV